ncbi:uncharacterized protein FTJAE_11374 [Fusarium tjaetaba]|uniref:Uncharacterized protein n=1 Tax=Fusarium tjaetaba TaxID=1567544 RepID=A0A8H5QUE6_9HYPO|nr:uncharacterized protein FTJAE_11374 [Fusarium tjaetaba]KAF5621345.1 hypothetical protein FTJAE_11374 [Fusarium tjaetaba]
MLTTKLLMMTMATFVTATPIASAPKAESTAWSPLNAEDKIDWHGVDKKAFKDPANWNNTASAGTTERPADSMVILAGPCEQGTCPDYNAAFDLVYTFINDCNNCQRTKVGSSLGGTVAGGCLDFTSCGRAQTICVDPGKTRAHRIWKDKNVKTCYNLRVEDLGSCGFVKSRIVLHPTGETACNW